MRIGKSAVSVLMVLAVLLCACGPMADTKPPDKVSVRLKWLHDAQFAGLYLAAEKGFFKAENLDVEFREGGPDIDELQMVASGADDFGIVAPLQTIIAISHGTPVTAIAALFQQTPTVYFALKESGIERPADLVGKKVMVYDADFILPTMLAGLGIGMDQLQRVAPRTDLEALYNGEVDVWTGYVTNQVVEARRSGHEVNVIYPDDYGVHLYGDVLIARRDLVAERPELVERFLRATLRGWRYAIEQPGEALDATLKYAPKLDRPPQEAAMMAQIPLVHTGAVEIGAMRDEIWQGMVGLLQARHMLTRTVELDQVYTTQFLQAVYGEQE